MSGDGRWLTASSVGSVGATRALLVTPDGVTFGIAQLTARIRTSIFSAQDGLAAGVFLQLHARAREFGRNSAAPLGVTAGHARTEWVDPLLPGFTGQRG
jgi:hypothetical protein